MAFGKRTDDVIGSVPNKPKLTKYIMMTKPSHNTASDKDNIVKQLESKKEDLFNNFENDEDINFLSFESEGFIPIEDDFNKLKKLFLDSTAEFPIRISNKFQDSDDFIFTSLNNFELNECLINFNSLNLYLTVGFFEFGRYKGPLFFIPLIIENDYIKRDYNKDIKFNYFLKAELKYEEDIVLPDINLNVEKYIIELRKNNNFKISDKSYVGNFYFRNLLIYNDLTLDNWYNSYDKFKTYLKNEHIYSIAEFKKLNNDIAKKWPSLNLEYDKDFKMKGADKLITNLLSEGNSILYVSNYYSKNEVMKSLSNNHLNSLILDFDYSVDKYSIFKNVGKDLFSFNDEKDISKLAEIKIYNENMFNIFKNNYSNLNLTPFEIQEKLNEFSQYDYNLNLNIDESLLKDIEKVNKEINDIQNNADLINIIANSEDFNFTYDQFKNYINLFDSILDDLEDFESINQELNDKFGLLNFDNLVLPQYIENFKLINDESKYLVKEDYDNINEFLKVNHDYHNLKNNGIRLFSDKINKHVDNIVSRKSKLENFNDKIDEINSLVEYLDISNCSFEESIEYLSLLFNHPKLIEDENELNHIVKIIEEYQNEKNFEGLLINQLRNFWNEHDEINQILNEYDNYINNNSENLSLYKDIKKLSKLFSEAGFNFKTLNEYFSLKDKLKSFKNAEYVENDSYFELNDYLKEFLKTYGDSLNNYLNNLNSKLICIFNEIKDIIHNRYSTSYKEELFSNITEILNIQKDFGFSFDNFEELVEYEDFIKYLNNNPNFDLDFTNKSLVNNFEIINGFDISKTINDYIDLRINDYKSIIRNINDLAEEYLKKNYDWSYIKCNIQKIIEIKDNLGINLNSINDLRNNEYILDILIQNPQLNYNFEDYELYLNIYKICQEYEIYDIDELLSTLNKKHENSFKSIKKEIDPILNEEYDLKFIRVKISEIENIITDLSELINCIKIDKFNDIDDFVDNIQILKNNPTFIENYDEFNSYIETIDFLKNPTLLDEEFLTECNLKLINFNDLSFENKLVELENIINLCYDNNTSISLLNTKKDFAKLIENINKLNINYNIIDNLELDECIESLKPNYKLVPNNQNTASKLDTINENVPKIENSILRKIDPNNSIYDLKNYDLKSKNINLNKNQENNFLFNEMDNKELYPYLRNKNVSKKDIIDDLKLLEEYKDNFNELFDKISEYVMSNLKNIKEFSVKEEIYHNKIVEIMEISCPNSFTGLNSNIDDLKKEFENNKYFTQLVESGFFNETSYENLSFEEINKQIANLRKSKNELIELCKNSDFNLDDTFDNILNYINNLLNDIILFKEESKEIFSLDYLKEYVSEDLLLEYDNLNKDIIKLSNLDKSFTKKYFKDDYGITVKENIKLVDRFNNLIKDNVFTDNTIKFLDNTPQIDIESSIYNLKIYINSVYDNLIKKEFNLDDSFKLILDKIEIIHNDNLKFKEEIDENSYLLNLIDFVNYDKYAEKFISFIRKYNSKLNLSNQCETFKQILYELDALNEIYSDENYKNDLFAFTGNQINDELSKLKNNLIFNHLVNLGKIDNILPEDTSDLISLIDETKDLINENDYNVAFDELIEDNENTMVELNKFNEKFNKISNNLSNDNLEFLNLIPDIESLFNEYSIPLNEKFIDFNNDVSKYINLIKLCSSFNKDLFNLSKNELNEYVIKMDLNKEFSNLIDLKIFSKSVCNFYNGKYNDKLDEMESLSSNIANSISKLDLDKNMEDIVESDIEKLSNDYLEIIELKEKDSEDSKELIDNYLKIIDKLNNLNKNNLLLTDYSLIIQKIKEGLDNLIKIYGLEYEIQEKEELIKKHFIEIVYSDSFTIDQIYEKLRFDLEFTKCYHEEIFSDITINNSEVLQSIDLSLDESILKLYNSKDYLEVYNKNKVLIKEIVNFENDVATQKEFLINANELLNNEDLDSLLKLNIDSQLDEYKSRLDELRDINQKYFSKTEDVIKELRNHLAYTEIIENKLFDEKILSKSNLEDISNELDELNNIYYSLLKNIYKLNDFYEDYPYFELNQNSFTYEMSFETLKNNLNNFEDDLVNLNKINKINPIITSLIRQLHEHNIDFSKMQGIFNYNVYNTILNNFYDDFPEVKSKNLDSNHYKKEIEKIDKQINKNQFNQVLTEIYGNLHEKSNIELISNQKNSLNQKITNKTMGTIKETLNEFKEYILSVKPIFMMDINQFYEYISNEYESLFDYVILDKNFEFEELDTLTLFLRSKNKLIDLR